MKLVGERVKHRSDQLGEGIIINQTEKSFTVYFENAQKTMNFSMSNSFGKFLDLVDNSLNEELVEENNQISKLLEGASYQGQKRVVENEEDSEVLRTYRNVPSFCDSFKKSVLREMFFLQESGGKKYKLHDGIRLGENGSTSYSFETDEELNLPSGVDISITEEEGYSKGVVIDCEEFTVILSLESDKGDEVDELEFSVNPWILLNNLAERLDDLKSNYSPIVESIVTEGTSKIFYGYSYIEKGQDKAIHKTLKNEITFIWGPPGTGKTETLAKIAIAQMEEKKSVLMLSYSNVSVDGAALRVFNKCKSHEAGRILRYGYPRQKEIMDHPYLSSYKYILYQNPNLLTRRNALIEERIQLPKNSPRNVEIAKQLNAIRERIKKMEQEAVGDASFVSTTVSKAIMDSSIYKRKFDVVIFDEASMAYIPQIVFASNLARSRFICMGDFKQLPPIVQNSKKSILNYDIFNYDKIQYAVDDGRGHDWLCLLDTQYRMHPDIAEFVSKNMYHGLLKSADRLEERVMPITKSKPFPFHSMYLADLSGMMSVCLQTIDNSRFNVLSAFITFSLALQVESKFEVGIITPYSCQARLLQSMVRDYQEKDGSKKITSATVHQFQGSEKDVIIYDAVDCYRMRSPGVLLTSTVNDNANRLFNVALTRAKGKFICVANLNYMKTKIKSNKLMFSKLLKELETKHKYCNCGKLLEEADNNGFMKFFCNNDEDIPFYDDLISAQKEVCIDIPNKPSENYNFQTLCKVLELLETRNVKISIRAEVLSVMPECLKKYTSEYKFLGNPVVVIDKEITWFGIPNSDAEFITETGKISTLARPIIRVQGKHSARVLYGLLNMNKKEYIDDEDSE